MGSSQRNQSALSSWYVVATSAHMEAYAALNLQRQGFSTFLPRRKKTVKHGRKSTVKHTAYFPGYIFTSLDLNRDRWRSVNGTFGVRSLLMNDERPVPAPAGFVEVLIAASDGTGLIEISSSFGPGSKVKPLTGPFANCIGMIDSVEGPHRVRILFDIMSSKIPFSIERTNLMEAV